MKTQKFYGVFFSKLFFFKNNCKRKKLPDFFPRII